MKAWNQVNKTTVQRKYQRIKEKRKESKNMLSDDEAAYICASEDGVDLHKHLDKEIVEKIRQLNITYSPVKLTNDNLSKRSHSTTNNKKTNQEKTINFDKECSEIKDSLLPNRFIEEAKIMVAFYAKTYVFENSVRNVIRIVMKNKYGNKWWQNIDKNLQGKIENRKIQEKNYPWISKRGEDELCYSDVSDLKKIIEDNPNNFSFLGDRASLFNFFEIIEKIRNISAHHNIVDKDNRDALNVYLKNWTKAVESNKTFLQGINKEIQ